MTRYIDTVPTPAHVKPKKLIVLSAPRTGTHGLYLALQELGFKPYHMVEAIMDGPSAIRIMEEGMDAEFFHRGKRYGREEFDKWFADYDIIIEMPFFMLHSVVRAYPEAKFLLTERDPEKWAKSFENTIGHSCQRMEQLPMSVFKYFDSFVSNMSSFGRKQLGYCTNGFGLTEEGHRHLVENYEDYIAEVKRIVPPEQLKVCKLENGFGWKDICPYLGVTTPETDWPSLNKPEEFHTIAAPKFRNAFNKGLTGMISIMVPIVAAGVLYARRERLSLLS